MIGASTGELAEVSSLIGAIYDAALEPGLWAVVLDRITKFFSASHAAIISESAALLTGASHQSSIDLESQRDAYVGTYVYTNPLRVPTMMMMEVDQAFTVDALMPRKQYYATRYYREYIQGFGWGDAVMAVLDKSRTDIHLFCVVRSQNDPIFDERDVELVQLLTPHIRRAFNIGEALEQARGKAFALVEAFDGLAASVFFLDRLGRVVHMNDAARGLLLSSSVLRIKEDVLIAQDHAADEALRQLIAAVEGGDKAVGTKGIVVELDDDGDERYVAHFLALTSGSRQSVAAKRRAVGALFVRRVQFDAKTPIELMSIHYHLTAREMSVLIGIVEIGGVGPVADILGLGTGTVKSHLKSIFEKTGVTRQAELVTLTAGFMGPLAQV